MRFLRKKIPLFSGILLSCIVIDHPASYFFFQFTFKKWEAQDMQGS